MLPLTPGTTSPLKYAKASELIVSRLNSASLCLRLSIVSPKFGHFIICAKRFNVLTCRFFSLYRSRTAEAISL